MMQKHAALTTQVTEIGLPLQALHADTETVYLVSRSVKQTRCIRQTPLELRQCHWALLGLHQSFSELHSNRIPHLRIAHQVTDLDISGNNRVCVDLRAQEWHQKTKERENDAVSLCCS